MAVGRVKLKHSGVFVDHSDRVNSRITSATRRGVLNTAEHIRKRALERTYAITGGRWGNPTGSAGETWAVKDASGKVVRGQARETHGKEVGYSVQVGAWGDLGSPNYAGYITFLELGWTPGGWATGAKPQTGGHMLGLSLSEAVAAGTLPAAITKSWEYGR